MTNSIPVVTKELKNSLINYLTSNCLGFLIYKPDLGFNNPTQEQYLKRVNLEMDSAVEHEIGSFNLNGYQRCKAETIVDISESLTSIKYSVSFRAYGGPISPFTHVCISRGSPFTQDPITGNGRGDTAGTLIYASPVGDQEITLDDGEEYLADLFLHLTNYVY